MKRKLFVLGVLFFSASWGNAQLVPFGKGVLSPAGKNALRLQVQERVLQQTQYQFFDNLANSSHTVFYALPDNTIRFAPKINAATTADIARLEAVKKVSADRITLEQQRELARLAQVPAHITQQVSPSLVQIILPDLASNYTANGFIVNYNGTNWIALSYHVGGRVGNEREVKMLLKDGTEVGFLGKVTVAGNAGYYEADMSFIRVPDQWQDQVTALKIGPVKPDLPVYSFGSVAENSTHDDFLPVRRTVLKINGTSIQMTHAMPGEDPLKPVGINGYCGSPIVQEVNGQIRVVGIFTGHVDSVSADSPAISFAVDVYKVLPMLMDNPGYTRTLKFLGHTITEVPIDERLERILLWRAEAAGEKPHLVEVSELYHFPNKFSYEQAEFGLFNQELRSGDKIEFILKDRKDFRRISYIIP